MLRKGSITLLLEAMRAALRGAHHRVTHFSAQTVLLTYIERRERLGETPERKRFGEETRGETERLAESEWPR